MFVLVAVSSINTSWVGSSCPALVSTSAGASDRLAFALPRVGFFKADVVALEKTLTRAPTAADTLLGHGGEDLFKRRIPSFGALASPWNTASALM